MSKDVVVSSTVRLYTLHMLMPHRTDRTCTCDLRDQNMHASEFQRCVSASRHALRMCGMSHDATERCPAQRPHTSPQRCSTQRSARSLRVSLSQRHLTDSDTARTRVNAQSLRSDPAFSAPRVTARAPPRPPSRAPHGWRTAAAGAVRSHRRPQRPTARHRQHPWRRQQGRR